MMCEILSKLNRQYYCQVLEFLNITNRMQTATENLYKHSANLTNCTPILKYQLAPTPRNAFALELKLSFTQCASKSKQVKKSSANYASRSIYATCGPLMWKCCARVEFGLLFSSVDKRPFRTSYIKQRKVWARIRRDFARFFDREPWIEGNLDERREEREKNGRKRNESTVRHGDDDRKNLYSLSRLSRLSRATWTGPRIAWNTPRSRAKRDLNLYNLC